ncbi:MAG TPA: cupredoxin domain-containing protein [Stellaceae bacterium]|nr:cupredoxin domain-containing protein [Stellaceae bacterium]
MQVLLSLVTLFLLGAAAPALADTPEIAIAIKGQQFVPSEVEVPAGAKIRLAVRNEDTVPAEFESTELHREQVVIGGQQITIFVGPLDPGSYEFFNDFHPQSRGRLIAK